MSGISSWLQTNWQELGTFLVEIAFLVAAIWFAHNILKTLRAFLEQIGALLKLTITPPDARHDASQTEHNARSSLGETSPYWLTPSETQPAGEAESPALSEPAASGPGWLVRAWHGVVSCWHGVVAWMNVPMGSEQTGAWHRLAHWLRTPAGS